MWEFLELSGYPHHAQTELAVRLKEVDNGAWSNVTVSFPLGDFMQTIADYD